VLPAAFDGATHFWNFRCRRDADLLLEDSIRLARETRLLPTLRHLSSSFTEPFSEGTDMRGDEDLLSATALLDVLLRPEWVLSRSSARSAAVDNPADVLLHGSLDHC
jgi:hypothetical protein